MSEANGPDKSLLRWQESELKDAEERVLKAFREGWKTNDGLVEFVNGRMTVAVQPKGSSTPEKPGEGRTKDEWQNAILRAEFLRDLFLGNYGKFDPRLIVISRARIAGVLRLDYCESLLPLGFSKCIFSEGISLQNTTVPELILEECEVCSLAENDTFSENSECALYAKDAKVTTNVLLTKGFKANNKVILDGAGVGGQLDCRGGHFENGLRGWGLKVGGDVDLRDGFKASDLVDLYGVDIGKQLACKGGCFENGLRASNLKSGDDVLLTDGFKAKGEVRLYGAEIGGQLDCRGGHFEKGGVMARNLLVKKEFILCGAIIGDTRDTIDLVDAEVKGSFIFGKVIYPCRIEGFRYQLIKHSGKWKKGLEFLEKEGGLKKVKDELGNMKPPCLFLNRIRKWFYQLGKSRYSSQTFQPYEQLMAVYRRMGHSNWARNIGFAMEKKRSMEFRGWRRFPWRMWYCILRWTIGYGYRPFAFFLWAIGLLAMGWFLFGGCAEKLVSYTPPRWSPAFAVTALDFIADGLANEWIPSEVEAWESDSWEQSRKPPPDYLPFNPLVYSLESTFPVLSLGQLEKWHPSNGFLLKVRWAWTLIGTLLLAILALFGAGVLGPRWRSGDEGD